jgi:O-antigen/teichoic acid export membrane protein
MILAIAYPVDRFNGIALDVTHNSRINFYKMVIVISLKIAAGFLLTELLKNVYGIIAANYISLIVSIIYGYYQLNKHVPHSLFGIIGIGYKECILLVQKTYRSIKK